MKHLNHVKKYNAGNGSLKDLAGDIENMSYDAVSEFLSHLAEALHQRAGRDRNDKKKHLSQHLDRASFNIDSAVLDMNEAWDICRKYTR